MRWFDLVFLNELGAQEALRIQRMENRLQLLNTESNVIALANWS